MTTVDLTAEVAATTQLLLEPLSWRIRAVERIEITSADRCARRRSLQCAPVRPILSKVHDFKDSDESVFVVLHVATTARGPLLDFEVTGPDGSPAFLIPRLEIAERESALLVALLESVELTVSDDVRHCLSALLGWTKGADWTGDALATPLQAYLTDGLGISVEDHVLRRLTELDRECAALLDAYRDQPGLNVMTHPIYALPDMFKRAEATVAAEGIALLQAYRDVLQEVAQRALEDESAHTVLEALTDYGHSYDMLVAVEVPLDRPFILTYEESRSIRFGRLGQAVQDVVLADANTNHVSVHVSDPNVRLQDLVARHPLHDVDTYGSFSVSKQASVWTLYAHGLDRDYRARLKMRLSPLRRLTLVNYFAVLLVAAVSTVLIRENPSNRDLVLLAGPTALAATILLAREPSTLGSRLRVVPTAALGFALLVMVIVAASLYVGHVQAVDDVITRVRQKF